MQRRHVSDEELVAEVQQGQRAKLGMMMRGARPSNWIWLIQSPPGDWWLSAVTQEGALGAHETSIRVFQSFFVNVNLPVTMTRGDEVAVPAVVYHYLDQPQIVRLDLANADWFQLQDETAKQITLEAGEVRATSFRIRVQRVDTHWLRITARAASGQARRASCSQPSRAH